MTFEEFHEGLRVLLNIDRNRLDSAGVVLTDSDWKHFREDPYRCFLFLSDNEARKVWTLISGQEVCEDCHGTGALDAPFSGSDPSCPDCLGTGTLE